MHRTVHPNGKIEIVCDGEPLNDIHRGALIWYEGDVKIVYRGRIHRGEPLDRGGRVKVEEGKDDVYLTVASS